MELPFKPAHVLHNHGGKVVEITGIGHKTDKPQSGYSRDYWFFIGRVQWDDTGKIGDSGHIDIGWLCHDSPEGFEEIKGLAALMTDYLNKHGEWCDGKSKHEGWYAHRKERSAA